LKETIERLEEKFLSICEKKAFLETSGSCAIVILVLGKKYYIANVGDSRALSLSMETVTQLTVDHKPEGKDEKLRILQHGGKLYREELPGKSMNSQVKLFSQTRIMPGSLNVSRTLGDI
jgi:serine/threonine protein phosphatase PrpC